MKICLSHIDENNEIFQLQGFHNDLQGLSFKLLVPYKPVQEFVADDSPSEKY